MYQAVTNTGGCAPEQISSSSANDPAHRMDLGTVDWEMPSLLKNGALTASVGGPSEGSDELDDVSKKHADANYRMAMDWKILLCIFPEEVWLQILDSINDTAILERVCNASLAFRQLLLSRRVQFLFPKFWDIFAVMQYQETSNSTRHTNQSCNQRRAYNFPFPANRQESLRFSDLTNVASVTRIWLTGILKLRMICKSWCDAVDSWIQFHQHRYQLNDDIEQLPADLVFREISGFEESWFAASVVNRMELFRTNFMPSHVSDGVAQRNPFLGRTVLLRGGAELHFYQAEHFWERANELFLAYGSHISYLTVNIEEGLMSTNECYAVIRALLQAAPNLKKLHLSYKNWRPERGYLGSGYWDNDLISLRRVIRSNPLPRLASLNFITTQPIHLMEAILPLPLYKELLRTNENITKLEIYHRSTLYEYGVTRVTVPNLNELSIRFRSSLEFVAFFGNDVNWNLSKLKLNLEGATSLELWRVFQELGVKWGGSLTSLQLKLPKLEREEDQIRFLKQSGDFQLNLPRLVQLELTLENVVCLDFLLPMKLLETLELFMCVTVKNTEALSYMKSVEIGKAIKLLSAAENLAESNIFELFTRLRRLKFDCELKNPLQTSKCLKYNFKVERALNTQK